MKKISAKELVKNFNANAISYTDALIYAAKNYDEVGQDWENETTIFVDDGGNRMKIGSERQLVLINK